MGDFNGKAYKNPFISDLVTFVAADSFQTMFEKFFLDNALEFTSEEEHKLSYFDHYTNFQSLFEGQLEDFCRAQDIEISEFVKKCRMASEDDPKAMHYINILLSSVEYDTFVKLMKIMRPIAVARQKLIMRADAKSSAGEGSAKELSPSKRSASSKGASFEGNDDDNDNNPSDSKGVSYSPSDSKGAATEAFDDGDKFASSK